MKKEEGGISTISYEYTTNYSTKIEKEANNFFFSSINYQEYQVDITIFKNCDLHHKNSLFDFSSSQAHQITTDDSKCNEKNKSLSNDSDQICVRQDQFNLIYFGFLYKNQISSNLSSTKKLFLSLINKLCNSAFGRAHEMSVNLSNVEISSRSNGRFSAKQVIRHLEDLASEGVIEIYYVHSNRWIKIRKEQNQKFMPIVDCVNGNKTNFLNASEILILSKLLDKSSFLFKAGLGYKLNRIQMLNLLSETPALCEKSIRRALIKINSLGLIICDSAKSFFSGCKICDFLARLYTNLFKIKASKKCAELVKKEALEKILRKSKDSAAVSIIKYYRERKRRLANCEAEKASPIAEASSPIAQSSSAAQSNEKESAWNRLLSKFFGNVNQSFCSLTQEQTLKILDFFTADKKVQTHKRIWTKKSVDFLYI